VSKVEATAEQISDMRECSDVLFQIAHAMCDEHEPIIVLTAIANAFWNIAINISNPHELINNMRVTESLMETASSAAKEYILASVSNDATKRGEFGHA